jgi:hypothetical protein
LGQNHWSNQLSRRDNGLEVINSSIIFGIEEDKAANKIPFTNRLLLLSHLGNAKKRRLQIFSFGNVVDLENFRHVIQKNCPGIHGEEEAPQTGTEVSFNKPSSSGGWRRRRFCWW